jgi:hypothetical protein
MFLERSSAVRLLNGNSGGLMTDAKQRQDVEQVMVSLEAGVGRAVDHDQLQAAVEADFRRFDGARIRDFVPVLVQNGIRARIMNARPS